MTPTPTDTPPEAAALDLERLEAELREMAKERRRSAVLIAVSNQPDVHYYRKGYGAGLENAADRVAEARAARQLTEPQGSRAKQQAAVAHLRKRLKESGAFHLLDEQPLWIVLDALTTPAADEQGGAG